ncbi:hypothetical protein ACM49_22480 [Escherichia coli]|nr:hypothetical protein ACM49_22480 [Escherichia coli]
MSKKLSYINKFCNVFTLFIYHFYSKEKIVEKKKKIWLCGAGNGYYENNIASIHDYILKSLPLAKNKNFFCNNKSGTFKR